jgi:O-antigen/teichoic acid export membrane protein
MTRAPSSLTAGARRGVRWTAINTFGTAALQMLQVFVLARLIGPTDFGRMAVVVALLPIVAVFAEMGLSSALIQRAQVTREEIATLYSINIAAGALLFVAIWIAAPLVERFYQMRDLTSMVRFTAGVFLLAPLGQIYRALLQKRLEFRSLAQINLTAQIAAAVGAIALALAGAGVWSLVAGYLLGEALTAAGLAQVARRRGYWAGLAWNLPAVRDYLTYGGLRVAAMVANSINSRIDQLTIGHAMGPATLGFYSIAQRLSMEPVQRINPIVTQVAFPVLSRVQDDISRMQRGYLRMIAVVSAVNAPLLVGLATTAPLVVRIFLGPRWEPAVPLLGVLSIYALLRSIANASGTIVLAAGRADWSLYWNLSMLLVIPAIVLFAVHGTQSVLAVAVALVVLQAALVLVQYFYFVRRIVGPCGRAYASVVLRPLACAALMGAGVLAVRGVVDDLPPVVALTLLVALGAGTYAAVSMAWQRDVVREVSAALPWRRAREGLDDA